MDEDRAWFGPRSYGYGIGVTPRAWQGWAVTAVFVAAEIGVRVLQGPGAAPRMVLLAHLGVLAVYVAVVVATSSPNAWKWRGGK